MKLKCMVGAVALALASVAQADVVSTFTFISSPQLAGASGTVTLHQANPFEVDVTVALTPFGQTRFVDTGGPHDAFAFNLSGLGSNYTVENVLPNWMVAIAPANDTPYGVYTNGIQCAACGPGASNSDPFGLGPISFSVLDPDGIGFGNFTTNAAGYLFAADIIGPLGGTGAIAATGYNPPPPPPPPPPPGTVPEPDSLALFGFALLGIAAGCNKKRFLPK
jgi:hypothetical protein